MFQNYNINQAEKLSIIENWLGRKGLQLSETLTQEEQETCNDEERCF